MLAQRQRTVLYAGLALVAIWILALAGYFVAENSKMTAEKVRAYVASVDLSKLSAAERARAIQGLVDRLNALPYEERQRARLDRLGVRWFDQMTEQEKSDFIDKTLPTGFQQMIAAFEQMPEERRRKAIDDSLRRLRESQQQLQAGEVPSAGTPGGPPPPAISPELQNKIRTIGLAAYFSHSSAQTKAELAPLLEELQLTMELGGRWHHP